MRTIIRTKLLLGPKVELRDYEVNKLVKAGKSVRILIDNSALPQHDEYMILTPGQLKKGRINNTQFSKYNYGQTYLLMEFDWVGKKMEREEDVSININTRMRLSEMWKGIISK